MYNNDLSELRSHVGLIIHSTTLDTEAKVKAIYGGTTWIQHTGYVLRGANSGVTANQATKDGGSDDAIVPYHNHSVSAVSNAITGGSHNHKISPGGRTQQYAFGDFQSAPIYNASQTHNVTNNVTDTSTHTHNLPAHNTNYVGTSGNTTNANIPNYKSVYIWERTA